MSQTKVTDNLRDTTQLDGAKITTGTIPEARITALDATKLTGTVADARVPASAVTQHVTAYNDASLRADILNLALNQAIADNRVAFNLDNSFVDGFEDSTGITTETTVFRNTSSEYISTISSPPGPDSSYVLIVESDTTGGGNSFTDRSSTPHTLSITSDPEHSTSQKKIGASSIHFDSGDKIYASAHHADFAFGTADFTLETWLRWDAVIDNKTIIGNRDTSGNTATWMFYLGVGGKLTLSDASAIRAVSSSTTVPATTWTHCAVVRDSGTLRLYQNGVQVGSAAFTGDLSSSNEAYIGDGDISGWNGAFVGYMDAVRVSKGVCRYPDGSSFTPFTENFGSGTSATGTLISDPQTASSSRTSCSGVIMYEDESGTATLGTDLKIYCTANNGTNWTEAASYGTAMTYSEGKKLVKLGATTVTGGTQVALKGVWANQVSPVDTILDSSGTSKTISQAGTSNVTQSTSVVKWDGTSLYFNGGAKLSVAAHTDFDFAAADTTIEFWYYSTVIADDRIIGRGSHPSEWFYRSKFASVSENWKSYINGGVQASSVSSRYGALNTWTHAAIVRDGSTLRVYTGGVQRWSTSVSNNWTVTNTNNALGIGAGIDAGQSEYYTGYLDDIRISNTARYPDGTTFSVPSARLTTDSNTKLLITGNAAGKITRLHGWAVNY